MIGSRTCHILIPGAFDYVTLHGKRDFAHVIKNLEIGQLGEPNVVNKDSYKRKARGSESEGNWKMPCFEDGGWGHNPWDAGSP